MTLLKHGHERRIVKPLEEIDMVRKYAAGTLCAGAIVGFSGFALAQTPAPAAAAAAAPAAPASVSLPVPGMGPSLAFQSVPYSLDVGPLGKWYVDGVLSGIGFVQSDAVASDKNGLADLSNGQIFLQKIDGMVQFYVQAGAYSLPILGTPYSHLTDSANALNNFFSAVPQAFLNRQDAGARHTRDGHHLLGRPGRRRGDDAARKHQPPGGVGPVRGHRHRERPALPVGWGCCHV